MLRLGFRIDPEPDLLHAAKLAKKLLKLSCKAPFFGPVEIKKRDVTSDDLIGRETSALTGGWDENLCLGIDKSIISSLDDCWRLGF